MSRRNAVPVGAHAGVLLAVCGLVAVLTGRPFVFPSLGPSAYLMAVDGDAESPRRVIGGHAVGVVAGLLAYHALAGGLVVTGDLSPLTWTTARLAASGALSVALAGAGMVATDTRHAPAAATTLIVSLGLLSTTLDGVIIVLSVAILYLGDVALSRLGDDSR